VPIVPPQPAETSCRIVGIVERETGPGGIGVQVTPIMLPLARAKTMALRANAYLSITVKVAGAQFTQDVEDAIKKRGLTAFSINDALQGAKRAFILLDIVLSLIGSIALAVSSLGIVNTMVMSILERTREIGIMKAIGGSDADIRRIFLIEASAIGLFGGVAGVALGWLVGRIVNFGANVYIQQQGGPTGNLFSLPFWLVGGAIGFSIVVSLVAGSYPAARAARLNPIDALRHD
jgi:putative ABC transport system permease protein